MKKKTVFVLAIAVVVLSCAGYSNATVLGTIESNGAGKGFSASPEMIFSIYYPLPRDWVSISLSWDVTPDDVGKTFFASADTHENFDIFTRLLTNGVNNGLFLSNNYGMFLANIATGLPEPIEYESTIITGVQDGVDFEGYTVDSIALTVNELFLDSHVEPGIRGSLGSTDYSYDITYTINGAETIPEPATVMLLGLGCLALRRRKRA